MKLNEDKCTAWTTDGRPPETHMARTLWDNAGDHGGFVVCGFPATCDDPAAEATLAFPIENPNFVEKFLEKKENGHRGANHKNSPHGDAGERLDPRRSSILLPTPRMYPPESGTPLEDHPALPVERPGNPP